MIRLAAVIEAFEADFRAQYRDQLTPAHGQALAAMKDCRTQASPKMRVQCNSPFTFCLDTCLTFKVRGAARRSIAQRPCTARLEPTAITSRKFPIWTGR
jgi:hypothetical protein